MPRKLSDTQRALIDHIKPAGRIERRPGGFWCAPGTPNDERGVPAIWFGTQTVEALANRAVLIVSQHKESHGRSFAVEYQLKEETDNGADQIA